MKRGVFLTADILLPKSDFEKWSVIACDQYSSDKAYWQRVYDQTQGYATTASIVIPEARLREGNIEAAAERCEAEMARYLREGVFNTVENSFIYIEREVEGGIRRGLIGKLDLEEYEFKSGNTAVVRASEGTVVSRLPARITLRSRAPIEAPHVLVLINDENKTVIEPIGERTEEFEKLYDFDLMEGGGHITGWQISGADAETVLTALDGLGGDFQMVIGDGNHSLAAAKSCWDEMKGSLTAQERENHPMRYALVELNNVYDDGVRFFPIHRVLFGVDAERFIAEAEAYFSGDGEAVKWAVGDKSGELFCHAPSMGAFIGNIQRFIDEYLEQNGGEVDYIHDDTAVEAMAAKGNLALFMPTPKKSDLFDTVRREGVFPRKSFSIGESHDKRYYLECRKIIK